MKQSGFTEDKLERRYYSPQTSVRKVSKRSRKSSPWSELNSPWPCAEPSLLESLEVRVVAGELIELLELLRAAVRRDVPGQAVWINGQAVGSDFAGLTPAADDGERGRVEEVVAADPDERRRVSLGLPERFGTVAGPVITPLCSLGRAECRLAWYRFVRLGSRAVLRLRGRGGASPPRRRTPSAE